MRLNVPPDRLDPRSGGPQPDDLLDLSSGDRIKKMLATDVDLSFSAGS
jgi:hypothetical protein